MTKNISRGSTSQESSQSFSNGPRRPPNCQLCRTDGHYANKCPRVSSFASASNTNEDITQAFQAQCHVTTEAPDWLADSVATTHMTNSTGPLHNTIPYTGDSKLSGNSKGNNRIASSTVRDMFPEIKDVPADSLSPSPSLKEYRFDDLKTATRDFSQDFFLGEGGFEEVFLGWVDKKTLAPSEYGDGIDVAVKRLRQESNQGYAEWLESLTSHCPDNSLGDTDDKAIDQVAANTIHPNDIRKDFNAKLGDFGSVKYGPGTGKTHITTLVKGSSGYVDPEYYKTGHLTMKTDIYGFGMVVLESITGRPAIFFSNDEPQTLVKWVSDKDISNGRQLKKIMDPCLEDKYPLKGAFKCFALAARCLADNPKDRPSSKKVQKTLEHIYALYK
ncbi:putative serine/threonine-protein kinase CST [Bidens hawaiensis]|uniref:putative serine/threonine-protein kinase CST n=1 Tax=Bidens hawaiensis TaxID=980011 RepID=UPI004049532B